MPVAQTEHVHVIAAVADQHVVPGPADQRVGRPRAVQRIVARSARERLHAVEVEPSGIPVQHVVAVRALHARHDHVPHRLRGPHGPVGELHPAHVPPRVAVRAAQRQRVRLAHPEHQVVARTRQRHHRRSHALREADHVVAPAAIVVLDHVVPVAQTEHVHVIAAVADQHVVPGPADQRVAARTTGQPVITITAE